MTVRMPVPNPESRLRAAEVGKRHYMTEQHAPRVCVGGTESHEDGDIVLRPLQDGDVVLFNRQPTMGQYSLNGTGSAPQNASPGALSASIPCSARRTMQTMTATR